MIKIFKMLVITGFIFFAGFCYANNSSKEERYVDKQIIFDTNGIQLAQMVKKYKQENPDICKLNDTAILLLLLVLTNDTDWPENRVMRILEYYDKNNSGFEILVDGFIEINSINFYIFFYKLFYPNTSMNNSEIASFLNAEQKKSEDEKSEKYKEFKELFLIFMTKLGEATGISKEQFYRDIENIAEEFSRFILESITKAIVDNINKHPNSNLRFEYVNLTRYS